MAEYNTGEKSYKTGNNATEAYKSALERAEKYLEATAPHQTWPNLELLSIPIRNQEWSLQSLLDILESPESYHWCLWGHWSDGGKALSDATYKR